MSHQRQWNSAVECVVNTAVVFNSLSQKIPMSPLGIARQIILVAASIGASVPVVAREWIYDQPYLGRGTLRMYSGEQVLQDRALDFGHLLAESDLIFLGNYRDADAVKLDPIDNRTQYTAKIRIGEVFRGMPPGKSMNLTWSMWTTGVAEQGRILFFVRRVKEKPFYQVVDVAFVHRDDVNAILLYGLSHDLKTDFVLQLLRVAIDRKAPGGFQEDLVKMVRGNLAYAPLLSALPVEIARPGWHSGLQSSIADHTSLNRFAALSRDIIDRGNDDDVLALLAMTLTPNAGAEDALKVPFKAGQYTYYRFAEFIVYDLLRHRGDERIVKLLIQHVERHPQAAVSASFCLAEIGGASATTAIDKWRRDPGVVKLKAQYVGEHFGAIQEKTYAQMLDAAKAKLKRASNLE